MAVTYDSIASYTLPSNSTSHTFTSLSQAFTDINFVITNLNGNPTSVYLRFNGDTTSNYGTIAMNAQGASTQGSDTQISAAALSIGAAYNSSPYSSSIEGWILGYSVANTGKPVVGTRYNYFGTVCATVGGCWKNTTDPITSITVLSDDLMYAGTKIALFGVKTL
jgi:hypothetical protein